MLSSSVSDDFTIYDDTSVNTDDFKENQVPPGSGEKVDSRNRERLTLLGLLSPSEEQEQAGHEFLSTSAARTSINDSSLFQCLTGVVEWLIMLRFCGSIRKR